MTKVLTVIGWNEPDGTRHEAGEVTVIDPEKVFDFLELSQAGTIQILPDEPPKETKPFKPPMETKEQGNE